MKKEKYNNFSVEIYGDLIPYNQVLSKARVRIFYKYGNRNGSYITDEFAEKLISTLPYAPIKGIYSPPEQDYTDHGKARDLGRIYGIVPEEMNFAWEEHLDKDGIVRTYACTDVLLFTALYPEAKQIIGSSQSMELYRPSLRGDWQIIDDEEYYVYTDGCFLGLQVLGEKVEPCFEGAAFFNLYNSLKEFVEKIEKFNYNKIGGQHEMIKRISELLNTETEIFSVYNVVETEEKKTAYIFNLQDNKFLFCEFSVAEDNTITLGDLQDLYMFNATEAEYNALTEIRENEIDLTTVKEVFASVESLTNEKSVLEQKIVDFENSNATLIQERDEARNNFENAQTQISNCEESIKVLEGQNSELQETINGLEAFKKNVEDTQKKTIIEKYSQKLTEEQMKTVVENIDSYSIMDLEKELAYVFCSNFSFDTNEPKLPKVAETDPLSSILGKYEKK